MILAEPQCIMHLVVILELLHFTNVTGHFVLKDTMQAASMRVGIIAKLRMEFKLEDEKGYLQPYSYNPTGRPRDLSEWSRG